MSAGNVLTSLVLAAILLVFALVAAGTKPTCRADEYAMLPRGHWWICARAP